MQLSKNNMFYNETVSLVKKNYVLHRNLGEKLQTGDYKIATIQILDHLWPFMQKKTQKGDFQRTVAPKRHKSGDFQKNYPKIAKLRVARLFVTQKVNFSCPNSLIFKVRPKSAK